MEGKLRLGWKLKRDERGELVFDVLVKALHGEKRVREIATTVFHMDPDNWSQVRGGREMNGHVLACCVRLLPGIQLETYADIYVKSGES